MIQYKPYKKCKTCGKAFYVYVKNEWAYRYNNKYYCSWHCLRAAQPKKRIKNEVTEF